jgi:hypothetical protein
LRDALLERNELVGREINTVLEEAGGPRDLDAQVIDLTDNTQAREVPEDAASSS